MLIGLAILMVVYPVCLAIVMVTDAMCGWPLREALKNG